MTFVLVLAAVGPLDAQSTATGKGKPLVTGGGVYTWNDPVNGVSSPAGPFIRVQGDA